MNTNHKNLAVATGVALGSVLGAYIGMTVAAKKKSRDKKKREIQHLTHQFLDWAIENKTMEYTEYVRLWNEKVAYINLVKHF